MMMMEAFLLEGEAKTSASSRLLASPSAKWMLSALCPSRYSHSLRPISFTRRFSNTPSPPVTTTLTAQQDEVQPLVGSKSAQLHLSRVPAAGAGGVCDGAGLARGFPGEECGFGAGGVEDVGSQLLRDHGPAAPALQVVDLLVYVRADLLATTTITNDTDDSSPASRPSSANATATRCRVRRSATSRSAEKERSSSSMRWKLSRRKSALATPAWPSQTPKKETWRCLGLLLVRLVTMQMRSSLQLSTGPECELAEQPRMMPQGFEEILDLSISSGWIVLCDSSSSRTSRSCSLNDDECGRSNCLPSLPSRPDSSLFLRMAKPDCERGWSLSCALEVVRMGRSWSWSWSRTLVVRMARWSLRMLMSTLEMATMALLTRTELLSVGRLLSRMPRRMELDLTRSLRSIQYYKIQIHTHPPPLLAQFQPTSLVKFISRPPPAMEPVQDIYAEEFLPDQQPLREIAHYFAALFPSPAAPISDQEIMAEPVSSHKSSTILMDVLRTRSSFFSRELKVQMEKMLTHFCRLNRLEYKQGLNEILAPFAYFRTVGYSLSQCYALFRCFFDQYCLNFYYDKDFNSLEIIFKMVTVVIKYHDPALARYLENYEIEPQIYCISWLMTMFSSKLSLRLTYTLWQFLVTERDDFFIFFLIVAIIIVRKDTIIQTKTTSIFTVITNLLFRNDQELIHTIKVALLLRRTTPASLILFFKETRIFREKKNFKGISELLHKIDKVHVFLVTSGEVSLREHVKLGLCERHCYFCSLREPLKVPVAEGELREKFPILKAMIDISNDLRTMDYSIEFVAVDIRRDKTAQLPAIDGVHIYPINIDDPIEATEARFNESFMELKGQQHFLFILNDFSFERMEQLNSEQFAFCRKFIQILNSYSFNYLAILEGGEEAYFNFLLQNRMKSEILNSKLVPVSEWASEPDDQPLPLPNDACLLLSEIITLQRLYENRKLHFFEGCDTSEGQILLILEGFVVCVEKNVEVHKLLKRIRQRKAVLGMLIEEDWTAQIPFRILYLHSIYLVDKITVRLHHNNCLLLYLKDHQESLKAYRQRPRAALWKYSLEEVVREDMSKLETPPSVRRVNFDSASFEVVKEVSGLLKENYKEMVRVKRHIEEELERNDELNNNIIEDNDFSNRDLHGSQLN